MIIQKWNEKIKDYEDYEIPDNWHTPLISDNMDEIINCVNCGDKIKFGNGYTSQRYHNKNGIGYYECEECYFDYLPKYVKSNEE
jgi:hypothetical protein